MLLKGLLVGLLIFILFNLFRALPIMLKGQSDKPLSHYLGRRVMFSALLFVILLVAMATGYLEPNPRPF
ncbi:DUF2909 domain-containing protein [Photobacterium aphoticum]|uniref:DUF2909 domain-containing protein n=1 Tax=Photobacterium aphoticum TaxID=754436 RepID=A0A090QTW6_9GAMM|nr:DUF2909 domain-containing protein [Photobacterium aphoticum]KLV01585.1 hypothetical protein ABT58_07400 [Photobacterium aphoticum]PSU44862.1 DUF2909 domain-containing protein [Photobacterium aphoticum]GAL05713.1 hypothetical protein JCM19237_4786 [Photobacterium aphoticum]GHA43604.1 hypothetical protein GCM10007086_16520 [Photobacterium aphoticum]